MTQFIDLARIRVRSGDGGNGCVAWRREKYEPLGGPAGGSGGRGGNVYLEARADVGTLIDFRYKTSYEAEHGGKGLSKNKHGRDGNDLVIPVPVGTVVTDADTGAPLADLIETGQRALVAQGGRGGRGNAVLATATRRAPHYCEPGEAGISRDLQLELKLLADIGIIGLPNAGKSTLLSVLTAAKPKIAAYPFSTLEPNLGVMKRPDGGGYVLTDIPGLIEGASRGVGLGHQFLRHIERTRLLLHLVDISSQTLTHDLETIDRELAAYGHDLLQLPRIIVLNKLDLVEPEKVRAITSDIQSAGSSGKPPVLVISCATRYGIETLHNQLLELMSSLPARQQVLEIEPDLRATAHIDQGFEVRRKKGSFYISGDRVERMVSVTNLRDPESLHHLYRVMQAMGVIDQLVKQGATPGSEIVIGGVAFAFGDDMR